MLFVPWSGMCVRFCKVERKALSTIDFEAAKADMGDKNEKLSSDNRLYEKRYF